MMESTTPTPLKKIHTTTTTTTAAPSESPRRPQRHWSRDPRKCPHSDWTIHVEYPVPTNANANANANSNASTNANTNAIYATQTIVTDSYYLHTQTLDSLSEDRIPLFEPIFLNGLLAQTGDQESRLVLQDAATAQGFGILLDFLYIRTSSNTTGNIGNIGNNANANYDDEERLLANVQRGMALYRFAEYFHIAPLKAKLAAFYKASTAAIVTQANDDDHANHADHDHDEEEVEDPSMVRSTDATTPTAINENASVKTKETISVTASSVSSAKSSSSVTRPVTRPGTRRRSAKALSPKMDSSLLTPIKSSKNNFRTTPHPPESASNKFAKAMESMEYIHEDKLVPKLFSQALERRRLLRLPLHRKASENISCLVALCVDHNQDTINRKIFYQLTHKHYIPFIDQEAALQFLTLEADLCFWHDQVHFSSLQNRCLQSLLADWTGLRRKFKSDEAYWKTLRKLSPSILGILLLQSSDTPQGEDDLSTVMDFPELQPVLSI